MSSGTSGQARPLAYPLGVTAAALAGCAAVLPFGDVDQRAAAAAVALVVLGYSGIRLARALGALPHGLPEEVRTAGVPVRRVRQQHRLVSRSWLEIGVPGRPDRWWLPVYFTPELVRLTATEARVDARYIEVAGMRMLPAGRARDSEPAGRLLDNPVRPDPDAGRRARTANRLSRRLLLDAQPAVAAPIAALLWVYLDGGGFGAFLGALCVAGAAAVWLTAIRGSDPS
ncbi:hypothetical protein [Nocardia higoensis]|uniref:hypothetical protein n=1 Tax=Nocardia higoensis TaxID=228599 RepID=UPI000300CEB7|nr:hypothetical protein [Nocardia higoensis]